MIPRRTLRQDFKAWWKRFVGPKKPEGPFDRLCREMGLGSYDPGRCRYPPAREKAADLERSFVSLRNYMPPAIGPELVAGLMRLHEYFACRRGAGHTKLPSPQFGYLKHLLGGRCQEVVEYLVREKPANYLQALGLIKYVYDMPRPRGYPGGFIMGGLWGWLQGELEKP